MNIHILKGTFTEKNDGVLQGIFQVVFHIPISSPVTVKNIWKNGMR